MGLVITLPVITAFFIIGKDFIGLWMGPRYVSVAGAVLIFLSVPLLFAALQATSNQILYGMSRHQLYAWIVLTEALINLGLSIFLAYKVGVIGVAIGTMIPAIIFEGIFVPIYTAGLLKQSVWGFYWHSWVKPCVLSLPYAAWLFALHRLGWSNSWTGFVTTVASGLLIYAGMVWFGILSSDEKQSLMRRIRPVPAPVRATS
jgi:O-antigen/teichoic acid export membrane protein